MGEYIKNYIWEYLACVIMCAMLILNAAQGFYIPDALADSILTALAVSLVINGIFFVLSYNRISMIAGLCVAALLVMGAFLVLRVRGIDIVDEEGSETAFIIYWFIAAISAICVFFISRFRAGVIIVLLMGIFINAMLAYLQFEIKIWAAIVYAAAAVVLFMLKQFRHQMLNSSVASMSFAGFAGVSAAVVLAGVILSAGVFFALVRPLNPPAVDVKFFEKYIIYDIMEALGITDSYELPDPEHRTSNKDKNDNPDAKENGGETDGADDDVEVIKGPDGLDGRLQLSTLVLKQITPQMIIIFIVMLILLLVLPPLIKYLLRKRRFEKITRLGNQEQVITLYRFYLKKFKCLGWEKYEWETPEEYVARASSKLESYMKDTCGMDVLTKTFSKVRYAGIIPDDASCAQLQGIYAKLLKNCKKQLGFFRYSLKYYRL